MRACSPRPLVEGVFHNECMSAANVVELDVDAELIDRRVTERLYKPHMEQFLARFIQSVTCETTTNAVSMPETSATLEFTLGEEEAPAASSATTSGRVRLPSSVSCSSGSRAASSSSPSSSSPPSSSPPASPSPQRFKFHVTHPGSHWNSDIHWVSIDDKQTYAYFEQLFEELKVEEKMRAHENFVKVDPQVGRFRIFSAFLVVRSRCRTPYFHHDFGAGTTGKAFTLMTPLTEEEQLGRYEDGCHLLYKASSAEPPDDAASVGSSPYSFPREAGNLENPEHRRDLAAIKQYRYRRGKAVVFGHGFEHATQDGELEDREKEACFAFLCFTFGSPDAADWATIGPYAGAQGRVHWRCDGRMDLSANVIGGKYDNMRQERRSTGLATEETREKFWEILNASRASSVPGEKEIGSSKCNQAELRKISGIARNLRATLDNSWDSSSEAVLRLVQAYDAQVAFLEGRFRPRHCRYTGHPWRLAYEKLLQEAPRAEIVLCSRHNYLAVIHPAEYETNAVPELPVTERLRKAEVVGVFCHTRIEKGCVVEVNPVRHLLPTDAVPVEFFDFVFCSSSEGGPEAGRPAMEAEEEKEKPAVGTSCGQRRRQTMVLGHGSLMRVSGDSFNVRAISVGQENYCLFYAAETVYPGDELMLQERVLLEVCDEEQTAGIGDPSLGGCDESPSYTPEEGRAASEEPSRREQSDNTVSGGLLRSLGHHAPKLANLLVLSTNYVARSRIPCAGYGLFAGRAFHEGEAVEINYTICYNFWEANPYSIWRYVYGEDGNDECSNLMLGAASIINHGGKERANVEGYSLHKRGNFTVIQATRDIACSEELLADYGSTPTC